ncbi:MAG: MMPL family transporter [Coriobacteriales bacterium]|nr:MMPL family transporter [Coriobacteriales bacterium]
MRHRKAIIAFFVIAALVCAPLIPLVYVNYKVTDYLPAEAQSTIALEILSEQFDQAVPNARVMVTDVGITEALEYKQKIMQIDGVSDILWLDDIIDVRVPLASSDTSIVESYYKNNSALFEFSFEKGREKEITVKLQDLVGTSGAVSGDGPKMSSIQFGAFSEVLGAFLFLIPAIIILITLSTRAWLEPLLFFAAIGVSIVINMGTNLIFGSVSFITNSISPILQLAVSLDYSIFLLHSFDRQRVSAPSVEVAMQRAIKESFSTVTASASTTLFGFLALLFMAFLIGPDLGLNLAKGIAISFVCSLTFLPALALCACRLIDRTHHRPLLPSFANINRFLRHVAIPSLVIVALVAAPAFLGQQRTNFLYESDVATGTSRVFRENARINAIFGQSDIMVLLVPRGDIAREVALTAAIENLPHVTTVTAYTKSVSATIPIEAVPDSILKQFYGPDYARIIIATDAGGEGDVAFNTVKQIHALAEEFYNDQIQSAIGSQGVNAEQTVSLAVDDIKTYIAGSVASLSDIHDFVKTDNVVVNLIAVLAIFIVLMLTFRSLFLPLILVLTIECAIWINLSIPYFVGSQINFIGYLVICTVQLGATVDYAILLTSTYLRLRKEKQPKQAIHEALGMSFKSILVSAATLSVAGFAVYATSSTHAVADIGMLLGRGAIISLLLVVCFLPGALVVFDKAIAKTTWRPGFISSQAKGAPEHHVVPEPHVVSEPHVAPKFDEYDLKGVSKCI